MMKSQINKQNGSGLTDFEYAVAMVPVLRSLNLVFPNEIKQNLRFEVHAAGSTLSFREEKADDVYFMISGTAMAVNTADVTQNVIFESLDVGDMFGELSAIDGDPCPTEVVTTSTCRVCWMSNALFMSMIMSHEFSNTEILRWLSDKIRRAYKRIESLCVLTAEQRVCQELASRAVADPADSRRVRVFPVPTQQEIANTVGTTRQTVARVFGKLIRDQVIERRGQVLVFLDPVRLKQAAEPQKAT